MIAISCVTKVLLLVEHSNLLVFRKKGKFYPRINLSLTLQMSAGEYLVTVSLSPRQETQRITNVQ